MHALIMIALIPAWFRNRRAIRKMKRDSTKVVHSPLTGVSYRIRRAAFLDMMDFEKNHKTAAESAKWLLANLVISPKIHFGDESATPWAAVYWKSAAVDIAWIFNQITEFSNLNLEKPE